MLSWVIEKLKEHLQNSSNTQGHRKDTPYCWIKTSLLVTFTVHIFKLYFVMSFQRQVCHVIFFWMRKNSWDLDMNQGINFQWIKQVQTQVSIGTNLDSHDQLPGVWQEISHGVSLLNSCMVINLIICTLIWVQIMPFG